MGAVAAVAHRAQHGGTGVHGDGEVGHQANLALVHRVQLVQGRGDSAGGRQGLQHRRAPVAALEGGAGTLVVVAAMPAARGGHGITHHGQPAVERKHHVVR